MKHTAVSSKRARVVKKTATGAPIPRPRTMSWAEWSANCGLFPTLIAGQWFLRVHKRELAQEGVLMKANRVWFVLLPEVEHVVHGICKAIAREATID